MSDLGNKFQYHTMCFADADGDNEFLWLNSQGFLRPRQYFGYNKEYGVFKAATRAHPNVNYTYGDFNLQFPARLFRGDFQGGVVHYDSHSRFSTIAEEVQFIMQCLVSYKDSDLNNHPFVFALTTLVKSNRQPKPDTESFVEEFQKIMNRIRKGRWGGAAYMPGRVSVPRHFEYRNGLFSTMRQTIVTFS